MMIETLTVGSYLAHCRILTSAGKTLVLDPGDEPVRLSAALAGRDVVGIVCTHCHSDHIGAVNEVAALTGAPVMVGAADVVGVADPHLSGFDLEGSDYRVARVDRALTDGDVIAWGDDELLVISTPGHTPGSICLLHRGKGVLFSGDTLFHQGIGSTEWVGAEPDALVRSLARLASLDDTVQVMPGHGPETTIGDERRWNPLLRQDGR